MPIDVALRIDVDTYSGTRHGVPRLLATLDQYGIKGTFFFTLGPDNMGRHIWRLTRPAFLAKMLRSGAPSLYGWDILLRGVFWPGPKIGKRLAGVIIETAAAGHEIGLHAWDHHHWQMHVHAMTANEIHAEVRRGVQSLTQILGVPPRCSAAAGWRCSATALVEKEKFDFDYNSDCRGSGIFYPVVDGVRCVPQIPVTLPTYDEVIGRDGIDDGNYNEYLLSRISAERLNVLAIHAEVEGRSKNMLFRRFLDLAQARGMRFVPLQQILSTGRPVGPGEIVQGLVPGRDDPVCWQALPSQEPHGVRP